MRLGVKEKAKRKKWEMRFSLIKENKAFQKSYMEMGVKKLIRAGMVPARTWRVHAVAGKKSRTSLFMEAFGLQVEEEISTLPLYIKKHQRNQDSCLVRCA